MKKTSQNSVHQYKQQLYKCNGVYKVHKGGLCYFTIHDPTIHDPTMHDSCINYANMLSLYRDKSCKRDMQRPGYLSEENKIDQRSCNF